MKRNHSLGRIVAIAGNTLTELSRLRVFYVLLLFALVLIAGSVFMARLSFQQEFQILKDISLGAISIFTSILAIAASARLLPQDVEDRTVYTILARPVLRIEYLAGKLLGVLLLLAISTLVMGGLFFAVLYFREQSALAAAAHQTPGLPPEQIDEALRAVRAAGFRPDLLAALGVIFIKAAVLASLTLFISTFASSSIFTIVVAAFVYLIGHLQGTAREFWLQEQGAGWLTRVFLGCVALVFPDLQLFNFTDQVVAGAAIPTGLFAEAILLGCFYVVIYLLFSAAVFAKKEL
ncbi:MAG: hypothetical protein M3Y86_00690 [Verrucomicrobiota bacterium]|nr:hypothetical protein [Verrucomicrobiota bacterium]